MDQNVAWNPGFEVFDLLTLKLHKTWKKSFANPIQMCLGLVRYQDKKILGNSSFLHYISVRKQGTILGGDISIVKVVNFIYDEMKLLSKIYNLRGGSHLCDDLF